jgi:hypothetical protein
MVLPRLSPIRRTTSFSVVATPHATLNTRPEAAAAGADAAARFASTVLSI